VRDCTCARDSSSGKYTYTCPSCCEKALSMLRRLTAQIEMFIIDSDSSVSGLVEVEEKDILDSEGSEVVDLLP